MLRVGAAVFAGKGAGAGDFPCDCKRRLAEIGLDHALVVKFALSCRLWVHSGVVHRVSFNQRAASLAWYVIIMSAPARRMPVRISIATRSSSIQPLALAAFTIEYSPLTL